MPRKKKIGKRQIKARLKIHLLQGKSITHNQAQEKWGTNRLAVYIERLRKDGLRITTKIIHTPYETYGKYQHTI